MFSAWREGALRSEYFKEKLVTISDQIAHHENHEMAPPGWKPVWDRYGILFFTSYNTDTTQTKNPCTARSCRFFYKETIVSELRQIKLVRNRWWSHKRKKVLMNRNDCVWWHISSTGVVSIRDNRIGPLDSRFVSGKCWKIISSDEVYTLIAFSIVTESLRADIGKASLRNWNIVCMENWFSSIENINARKSSRNTAFSSVYHVDNFFRWSWLEVFKKTFNLPLKSLIRNIKWF